MEAPQHPAHLRATRPDGIRACAAAGFRALRARWPLLLAAVALLGALHLPQRWFQSQSEALLGAFQARAEERGGQAPAPEDAVADLGILASACGWNCGSLAYGLVVLVPAFAGAALAGARAVAGDASLADLRAGFGARFGPVLLAGIVTGFVGGGAAVLVSIIAVAGGLVRASGAVATLLGEDAARVLLLAAVLVTAWLTARLWFALPRAADPRRPRASGVACVVESWTATEGSGQWRVLGTMMLAAAIAVASVWPGAELAARAGEGAQVQAWMGWAAMAVGAGASAMLALAMLGASYESLMPGGTQ
jgi:hypothetical protein